MTHPTTTIPTVHLNGTSGEVLLEQLKGARRALDAALEALAAAAPNARDYYTQPGGFEPAQMHEVRSDVMAMQLGVRLQIDARAPRTHDGAPELTFTRDGRTFTDSEWSRRKI